MTVDAIQHKIPQNLEAEAHALGAALGQPRACRILLDRLTAEDFHRDQHREVFEAIQSVAGRGIEVEDRTVIDELKATKRLTAAGGAVGVVGLHEWSPSFANQPAYCDAIRQMSIRRKLVDAGHAIAVAGYEQVDPAVGLEAGERSILSVREFAEQRRALDGGVDLDSAAQEFAEAYKLGEDTDVVPFPIADLNKIGGGQRRGQIVVTGGYSADGKSWFGLECLEAAAMAGARTALFTLEVPREEIVARLVAMGGHDFRDVLRRALPLEQIQPRIAELRALKLMGHIYEGTTNMARIRSEVARAKFAGRPFRYVLVDHLHLLDVGAGGANYRHALNQALMQAKQIAVDFGLTIHFLAQLKRVGERKFPAPVMSDFRESSGIENIADYALFVYRERDSETQATTALAQLLVAKARSGVKPPALELRFDSTTYRLKPRVGPSGMLPPRPTVYTYPTTPQEVH